MTPTTLRATPGDFDSRVSGIPCRIKVVTLHVIQGNYSRVAETPDEYYGHSEIEFDILDRRGRPAAWLERKVTDKERQRIEGEILEHARD